MSQTLLIFDNEKIAQMYSINLSIYTGTDVIIKTDEQAAIELLRIHPGIDIIISKSHINNSPTAYLVFQFLQEQGRNIPFIMIGSDAQLPITVTKLEAGIDRKYLIQAVAKIFGITAKEMVNKLMPDYMPIPLTHFQLMDKAVCDLYVRVKKGPTEYQFIKKYHRGTIIPQAELEKLSTEAILSLYIESVHRVSFVNTFSEKLITTMGDNKLKIEDRTKVNAAAVHTISEQIMELGLTAETVDLANSTMKSMIRLSEDTPKISKLLLLLMAHKESYFFRHGQILTYICGHILKFTEWGSTEQLEKLCFVSFFHDMALMHNERYARMRSDEDMDREGLSSSEREIIKRHAQAVMVLLEQYPHVPMGADTIIKQHHGTKNGYGFTTSYTSGISPLAILFVIAQDFTDRIIDVDDIKSFKFEKALELMNKKFTNSKYQKVIKTLESLHL